MRTIPIDLSDDQHAALSLIAAARNRSRALTIPSAGHSAPSGTDSPGGDRHQKPAVRPSRPQRRNYSSDVPRPPPPIKGRKQIENPDAPD